MSPCFPWITSCKLHITMKPLNCPNCWNKKHFNPAVKNKIWTPKTFPYISYGGQCLYWQIIHSCYCTFPMSKVICTCLKLQGFTCSNYKGSGEPDQTTILDKLFPFLVNASYTIKYNILISETIRWIQCQLEFKLLVVTSLARRRADSNSSLGMLWVRVRATLLLDVINLINPPRQQEIGTNCLWKGPNASGNH